MQRVTLHVPEVLNDDSIVPPSYFAEIEDELCRVAGGFTLTHGIGCWRDNAGCLYREPLGLYIVDVASAASVTELRGLALRVGRALDQVAVYVTVAAVAVELDVRTPVE